MEKKKPRGMAPLEPVPHRNMLRQVITATVTPGKKQATRQHTCEGEGEGDTGRGRCCEVCGDAPLVEQGIDGELPVDKTIRNAMAPQAAPKQPLLPAHLEPALVRAVDQAPQPDGGVAGGHAEQQVHDQGGGEEGAAGGGGQEALGRGKGGREGGKGQRRC